MAAKSSFLIKVPLYRNRVRVCLDRESLKKYCKSEIPDNYMGLCLSEEGFHPVVALFDQSPSTIAHEMLHATFAILGSAGVSHSRDSEESFTYLLDYLVDQTHKQLEKINASSASSPDADAHNSTTSTAE